MPSSGPDWIDGPSSRNYSGCTLLCGMNKECPNFADNFIELTVAYLLLGMPWDGRLSRYYICGCRHTYMMGYSQSYTQRWGGEWSAGWHLMEVGTKRTHDYAGNWGKSLSRIDHCLQSLPSPHCHSHLCTFGHRSPEMDDQSVQARVKVFDCCCSSPEPHTPSGTGTLQWRCGQFCRLRY